MPDWRVVDTDSGAADAGGSGSGARSSIVLGLGGSSQFAQYRIRVLCGSARVPHWDVLRRFSEFDALQHGIGRFVALRAADQRPRATAHQLPELPSKLGLWRHFDDAYLEHRRTALEQWLWQVLRREELLQMPEVRSFIGLDEDRLTSLLEPA